MKTPQIPLDAPYSASQRAWLSGFFAGMHTRMIQTTDSASADVRILDILYGSQTGNAEAVANDAAAIAKTHGLKPVVRSMDEISVADLAAMEHLLLITSTYGEGEMPDNAQLLWESAQADTAPTLPKLHYSVLALGDTSYDLFCQAGKDWDNRLHQLGATRVYERTDCDVDFEEPAHVWLSAVIPQMADGAATTIVSPADTSTNDKPQYHRKNPFPAKMLANRWVTSPDSSKETRHYEISIAGSGLAYEAGDALCVVPTNCPDLVAELLAAIGCQGDEEEPVNGELMPLREALRTQFEIKNPSKELLEEIAKRSGDQELNGLLSAGSKDQLSDYLWGRDTLDLLLQFPQMEFSAAEFISLLKPLQHRAYSISSSSKAYPDTVHLTVASVRYDSHNRQHKGVCSTFLADLVTSDTKVRCFFTPNKVFRVPEDNSLPMIMVGPGTGIAPFRAFLQERQCRQATGKNWLFFGDRNAATDFLYQDELADMQASGLLTRLDLAFSRDQAEKIYVQDKMLDNAAELFAWLEAGGYFFVCGDAYRMAKDVDKALHEVIAQQGKLSAEQAAEYVNQLKKTKRYVRDVY
ncbi:sulfite reductase subunit alpha [Methylovulum psychrotolerans]|uniref:sulfite reductase subunit alpha n=1 Tax=Methylovulum psychrotolerans TaxID=1704499 RepID=UPI001BFF0819|nr:sulfite reductase subunit alpha [Methylovulum psychrotolerans]MBT9096779.1 sulfite reductase subunit alpha [Methylovulum psychrotolerans]